MHNAYTLYSAIIYHLHSSHLNFSTSLPPPTVNYLGDFMHCSLNNHEILSIDILISMHICEMNDSFRYCTITEWPIHSVSAERNKNVECVKITEGTFI